ncbi:hypothetical protein [Helicobacter ailurogastricus]|uniref:hypothetical protein n=1 Tax=Helicobacter ailurogastricus TaxID=1578720 RepID=UPI000CF18091|nr:hypothetical protein [Helicobacter ailurogastricus]
MGWGVGGGDAGGESVFWGAGAGGVATASAVVGDIVDFCKQRHTTQPKNLPPIALSPKAPKPHYVRLEQAMPKNIPATLHFCAGQSHIYTTQPTNTQDLQASLAHLGAGAQIYPLLA